MAKARPRFIITGNMRSNDVDLKGVRVILMGECNSFGTPRPAAHKAKKWDSQYDYCHFRYEDRKWARNSKLAGETFNIQKKWLTRFVTPLDPPNTP